jgi:hypothetical protein
MADENFCVVIMATESNHKRRQWAFRAEKATGETTNSFVRVSRQYTLGGIIRKALFGKRICLPFDERAV